MDTNVKNEGQTEATQNAASVTEQTGTATTGNATGNVTVANLEALGKPKRASIDWKPFHSEILSSAKAGKTQTQFINEYAAKYKVKPLTVQQKYSMLRLEVNEDATSTPEEKKNLLAAITFKDGRRVKGIHRTHDKTKKVTSVHSLKEMMGMLGDIPTETAGQNKDKNSESSTNSQLSSSEKSVGQELIPTPIPGLSVGQSPMGDITIRTDGRTITIHEDSNQLVGV